MADVKTIINIPAGYSYATKQEIAARILSAIIFNAKSGFDKNGNSFKNYSKAYAAEKGSTDVDLTETGQMLDSIKVLKIARDYIEIGYDGRTKQSAKAEGNILGSYGRVPNPAKARDFLGITDKGLSAILADYPMTKAEQGNQSLEDSASRVASGMTDNDFFELKKQQIK